MFEETITPEVVSNETKLESITNPIVKRALQLEIESLSQFEDMGIFLKDVKDSIKEVESATEKQVSTAYQAHKSAKEFQNKYIKPLKEAEKIGKQKMKEFYEKSYINDAFKKIESGSDIDAKLNDIDAKITDADSKSEIDKLQIERDTIILSEVEVPDFPKIKGIVLTDSYSIVVNDITKIPAEYMMVNEKAIKAVIKATAGAIKIPGINFAKTKTVSIR